MVNPIKNLSTLDNALEYLENKKFRDYMLLFLGVNFGLRISDLIELSYLDVDNKENIEIKTKKTGEKIKIPILPHVKIEISKYLNIKNDTFYLFTPKGKDKPLSRQRAYEILKNIEIMFKLETLGTHSMRKTFGYHYYKDTNDIATLMKLFGHKRESTTLLYIGITQERINDQFKKWGGIKRKGG